MNRPTVSSSGMKRTSALRSGSLMKRFSATGRRSSAIISCLFFRCCNLSAIEKPRLGMNGNGCAGSIDSGVSTGNTDSRKCSSSQASSSLVSALPWTLSMPSALSSSITLLRLSCWSCCRRLTSSSNCSSCCSGVRPSGLLVAMPSRTWPARPATRTMKNSSRLAAEIDRKRTRSSSGWWGFCDSSSTRRLNCSHENSRLTKRSGLPSEPASGVALCETNSFSVGLSSFIGSALFPRRAPGWPGRRSGNLSHWQAFATV